MTGSVLAWNPQASDGITALSVNGSTVYAGGDDDRRMGKIDRRISHPYFAQFGDFGTASVIPPRSRGAADPSLWPLSVKIDRHRTRLSISYDLEATAPVSLRLYTVQGRLLTSMVEAVQEPGSYRAAIDRPRFAGGCLILHCTAGRTEIVRRLPYY